MKRRTFFARMTGAVAALFVAPAVSKTSTDVAPDMMFSGNMLKYHNQ